MDSIKLEIPFALPLLGEAFVSAGNPLLTASLDFSWQVSVTKSPSDHVEVPIGSRQLNRVIAKFLSSQGLGGLYSISGPHIGGPHEDSVNFAALLYFSECEEIESALPEMLKNVGNEDFINAARALTSLSGGFVVSRQGEGFLSIDTSLSGPICLRFLESPPPLGRLENFSKAFPGLKEPTWHMLAHLVLEGVGALQRGDLEAFGRALSLENSLLHATGIISIAELQRISSFRSLGGKVVLLDGFAADILIPNGSCCPEGFQRTGFSMEGVREIEC